MSDPEKKAPNNLYLKYLGLASQLIVSLGASVWLGIYVDKKLAVNMPLCVWIFPLLIIIVMIVKVIKDVTEK